MDLLTLDLLRIRACVELHRANTLYFYGSLAYLFIGAFQNFYAYNPSFHETITIDADPDRGMLTAETYYSYAHVSLFVLADLLVCFANGVLLINALAYWYAYAIARQHQLLLAQLSREIDPGDEDEEQEEVEKDDGGASVASPLIAAVVTCDATDSVTDSGGSGGGRSSTNTSSTHNDALYIDLNDSETAPLSPLRTSEDAAPLSTSSSSSSRPSLPSLSSLWMSPFARMRPSRAFSFTSAAAPPSSPPSSSFKSTYTSTSTSTLTSTPDSSSTDSPPIPSHVLEREVNTFLFPAASDAIAEALGNIDSRPHHQHHHQLRAPSSARSLPSHPSRTRAFATVFLSTLVSPLYINTLEGKAELLNILGATLFFISSCLPLVAYLRTDWFSVPEHAASIGVGVSLLDNTEEWIDDMSFVLDLVAMIIYVLDAFLYIFIWYVNDQSGDRTKMERSERDVNVSASVSSSTKSAKSATSAKSVSLVDSDISGSSADQQVGEPDVEEDEHVNEEAIGEQSALLSTALKKRAHRSRSPSINGSAESSSCDASDSERGAHLHHHSQLHHHHNQHVQQLHNAIDVLDSPPSQHRMGLDPLQPRHDHDHDHDHAQPHQQSSQPRVDRSARRHKRTRSRSRPPHVHRTNSLVATLQSAAELHAKHDRMQTRAAMFSRRASNTLFSSLMQNAKRRPWFADALFWSVALNLIASSFYLGSVMYGLELRLSLGDAVAEFSASNNASILTWDNATIASFEEAFEGENIDVQLIGEAVKDDLAEAAAVAAAINASAVLAADSLAHEDGLSGGGGADAAMGASGDDSLSPRTVGAAIEAAAQQQAADELQALKEASGVVDSDRTGAIVDLQAVRAAKAAQAAYAAQVERVTAAEAAANFARAASIEDENMSLWKRLVYGTAFYQKVMTFIGDVFFVVCAWFAHAAWRQEFGKNLPGSSSLAAMRE